jgi:hypothetical protein
LSVGQRILRRGCQQLLDAQRVESAQLRQTCASVRRQSLIVHFKKLIKDWRENLKYKWNWGCYRQVLRR